MLLGLHHVNNGEAISRRLCILMPLGLLWIRAEGCFDWLNRPSENADAVGLSLTASRLKATRPMLLVVDSARTRPSWSPSVVSKWLARVGTIHQPSGSEPNALPIVLLANEIFVGCRCQARTGNCFLQGEVSYQLDDPALNWRRGRESNSRGFYPE